MNRVAFGGGAYIAAVSARARSLHSTVTSEWASALRARQIVTCPITTLELLFAARNAVESRELEADEATLVILRSRSQYSVRRSPRGATSVAERRIPPGRAPRRAHRRRRAARRHRRAPPSTGGASIATTTSEASCPPPFDALITALHVQLDDFLPARAGAGRPPKITDSELICLAVCQMLLALAQYRLTHLERGDERSGSATTPFSQAALNGALLKKHSASPSVTAQPVGTAFQVSPCGAGIAMAESRV